LKKLKVQQFFHLRPDPDFRSDIEKLVREVWDVVSNRRRGRGRRNGGATRAPSP